MSLVLSFGGPSKQAVIEAFRAVVGAVTAKIFVLSAEVEEGLDYREFDGPLDRALVSFAEGRSSSVHVRGQKRASFLAGIDRSRFANERLADWSAWVEGASFDAESAFNELQAIGGLTFVAISQDECLDLDVEHVTESNFPWSDWRLRAGAVRSQGGAWVIRVELNTSGLDC